MAVYYDRIIPNIDNFIGRKKGLHKSLTFVHALTLAEVKFKLKTALGVSNNFHQLCQAFPIYGTGQGSINVPTVCLNISSTIFNMHKKLGKGTQCCDPIQIVHVHITMAGLLDDVTGQTN
eukprot:13842117-Ditylum_brightwellii.AAC.1